MVFPNPFPHMNSPPAVLLPVHPRCASCTHANTCGLGACSLATSRMSARGSSAYVRQARRTRAASLTLFHRIPPPPTSTSPIHIFWRSTLRIFYYSTRCLGLHRVWFDAYRLIPNAHTSDLENAPTSRRSCWTKTVWKMNRVWTLIIMASSLIIT